MPAAAVIRVPQALSGFIGRKGRVGCSMRLLLNLFAQQRGRNKYGRTRGRQRLFGTHGVGVKSVDIVRNTKGEGK